MPPRAKPSLPLPPLTLAPLRTLALHFGTPLPPRKGPLQTSICTALAKGGPSPPPAVSPHTLISIDMGIRNFALAVVTVDGPAGRVRRYDPTSLSRPLCTVTPRVIAWRKVDLLSLLSEATSDVESSVDVDDSTKMITPTAISTATLKSLKTTDIPPLATRVVSKILLPLCHHPSPTILIEHQRHRSAGAKSVLQTAILVGALEIAVTAILRALWNIPAAGKNVTVPETRTMDPKRISSFWIRDIEKLLRKVIERNPRLMKFRKRKEADVEVMRVGGNKVEIVDNGKKLKSRRGRKKKKVSEEEDVEDIEDRDAEADATSARITAAIATKMAIKRARIELLTSWLENSHLDLVTPEAQEVGRLFVPEGETEEEDTGGKNKKKSKTKKKKSAANKQKIDDLADCMLQALYALRVEENIAAARRWGVEVFLEGGKAAEAAEEEEVEVKVERKKKGRVEEKEEENPMKPRRRRTKKTK